MIHFDYDTIGFTRLLSAKFECLSKVMNNRNNWYSLFDMIPPGELIRLNPRLFI